MDTYKGSRLIWRKTGIWNIYETEELGQNYGKIHGTVEEIVLYTRVVPESRKLFK